MKKNVIVCGLISGFIVSTIMVISMFMTSKNPDFEGSMVLGYASMLLAFSLVFVGMKIDRDKYHGGSITLGKAFLTGLYITLIASTMYVITWLIEYYMFIPDFMDKYAEHMLKAAKDSGMNEAKMTEQVKEMDNYKELYKNPVYVILFTYLEILPLGLIVTLISAFILKRKPKVAETQPS